MKKWLLMLAIAAAMLLAGCEGIFEEDYLSVTPHDEQYTVDEDSDALTAENYLGLKNAILSFVENHTEYGVIRIYHYDGAVESDLADATYEVAKADPLGAYAVDYMTHDCTLIVSYYEIHIYITFARTQEEIDGVRRVNSMAALREEFKNALKSGEESCVLRVSSYAEQDFTALARSCYYDDPYAFAELPTIETQLYPSTGVQRIVKIVFHYTRSAQTRLAAPEEMREAVSSLTSGISVIPVEGRRFTELTGRLLRWLDGAEVEEQAIFHDVLCHGKLNAESVALALRLLCDEIGVSCVEVSGRRNNLAYTWNIVTIGEMSYHVDLLRDQTNGEEDVRLYSDRDMEDEYSWDRDAYPACAELPTAPEVTPPAAGVTEPEDAPEPDGQSPEPDAPEPPAGIEEPRPEPPELPDAPEE